MLISVFALLEGSVSSLLLIAVEKEKYTQTHTQFDTKKKKKKKEKKNLKNWKDYHEKLPLHPSTGESDLEKKENEDSYKKYMFIRITHIFHSRNNRIYKLDANLTRSLRTVL